MTQYTIVSIDDFFMFEGKREDLVGTHLIEIMKRHKIHADAWSESHALSILNENGVDVFIVDTHGIPLEW